MVLKPAVWKLHADERGEERKVAIGQAKAEKAAANNGTVANPHVTVGMAGDPGQPDPSNQPPQMVVVVPQQVIIVEQHPDIVNATVAVPPVQN